MSRTLTRKGCINCAFAEEIDAHLEKVKCRIKGNILLRTVCLEHKFMTCSNCRFMNNLEVALRKERDDGGVHWKYVYGWTIDCEKDGKSKVDIEGTKHRATLPTCGLWEYGEKNNEGE